MPRKLKILLVDEARYRRLLSVELQQAYGHEIEEAGGYEEALQLFEQNPASFDLAIVDYSLEGERSGVELLRQLHEAEPNLPVIIITGVGDRKISQEALRAGAFWYLDKPHDWVELEMLLKWVGRYRATSQPVNPQSVWGANLWMHVSDGIVSAKAIPKLVEAVRNKARGLLEAESCGILEIDPETGTISDWSTAQGAEQALLGTLFSPLAADMAGLEEPNHASISEECGNDTQFRAWAACACPPNKGATEILFALFEKDLSEEQKRGIELKLVTLARLIGVALENLRKAKLLEALADSGKELLTARRRGEVYSILQKQIREKLKVRTFYLAIQQRATDTVHFPFFFHQGKEIGNLKPTLNRKEVSGKQSFTVFVLEQNKEMTIEDVSHHQYPTEPYAIQGVSAKAYFAVPLRRPDGSAFGVLSIQSAIRRRFPEPLKQAVRGLASLAAPTLNRLKRSRLQEKIFEKLLTDGPEGVLKESLHSAWEALGANLVVFYPYDARRKLFRINRILSYPDSISLAMLDHEIPLLTEVLRSGEQRVMGIDSLSQHWRDQYGTNQLTAVPISPGIPSGLLLLHHKKSHQLNQSELQTEVALFSQCESIVTPMIDQQELLRVDRQKEKLLDTLRLAMDRQELARLVEDKTPPIWPGRNTCFFLLADRGARRLQSPLRPDSPEVPFGSSLAGQVALSGESILIRNPSDLLHTKPFSPETRSALCVPIKLGGSLLGVISLESPDEDLFEEEDRLFLDRIATSAVSTLIAASKKEYTDMVTDAARKAARDPERGLEIIAESVHNIAIRAGGAPTSTTVFLVTGKELELAWAWPEDQREGLWHKVGSLPLEETPGQQLGIVARAALDKKTMYVPDVSKRDDYIPFDPNTCAELAVPVLTADHASVIGVLNLEYAGASNLESLHETLVESFADQAEVIAILQSQSRDLSLQRRDLAEKAKEKAIAQTLAFAGLQFTELAHRLGGMVMLIKAIEDEGIRIKNFWNNLKTQQPCNGDPFQISNMDEAVDYLLSFSQRASRGIESDLHDEKNPERMEITNVKQWLTKLAENWISTANFSLDIDISDSRQISANSYWLEKGIENILKNSENALRGLEQPELRLEATTLGGKLLIIICDNGPGIPSDIRQHLFVERVPGRGPGHGLGCLMTSFIVSFHGGEIFSLDTNNKGTRIIIRIPLVRTEEQ